MYRNFGDKNFFEYGVLVDNEHSDHEYQMLVCMPNPDLENIFMFANITVDIEDSWIDQNIIEQYSGKTKEEDPVEYAIACYEYYGAQNFGAYSNTAYDWQHADKELIKKELRNYQIAWDEVEAD